MPFEFPDQEIVDAFGDCAHYFDGEIHRTISAVFDKTPAELIPGFESRTGELIMSITCTCEQIPCPKKGHTFEICGVTYKVDRVLQSDGYVQTIVVR